MTSRHLAIAVLALGPLLGSCESDTRPGDPSSHRSPTAQSAEEVWTCAMHQHVRRPTPGACPLCGMDLVPVEDAPSPSADGDAPTLTMSPAAVALADVETAPVVRGSIAKEVRLVGKVDYDETRVRTIAAWASGRIDRLFVDFTGIEVNKGEHLVYLYSPELRTAQEELLQAHRAVHRARGRESSVLEASSAATVRAAREKLRLLGFTAEQLAEIERRGTPSDRVTIYAPVGGTVVGKQAFEGMYVETGTPIYQIADLSNVWVRLDAYESDIAWIRYGQDVAFTAEAYPGDEFHGRVAFIEPTLDPRTRTVKVRVNVDNTDGLLKPEMFVRAVLHADVTGGGKVMDPELAGKWIAPMHPEIIRDEPGACPMCGMALVRAEDSGYVRPRGQDTPLLIPATAPLITGERAIVYVRVPETDDPTFEGRQVVLGPRSGDHYVVRSGLAAGEEVVVRGAFKIDSALQIRARRSMMNPGGAPAPEHTH